jgi:hypothetical protein
MKYRSIALSFLTMALLAPVAMACDSPAGSEVDNKHGDYLVKDGSDVCTQIKRPHMTQRKSLSAPVAGPIKRGSIGEFIDETTEEQHQRSSNH